MDIKFLRKSELNKVFEEKSGSRDRVSGFVDRRDSGNITLYLKQGATTGTRLHELYHAKYSPELQELRLGNKRETPKSSALEEIRAIKFSKDRRSGVLKGNDLYGLGSSMVTTFKYKPSESINAIEWALNKEGYSLPKNIKSILWAQMKEEYQDARKAL